MATCRPLGGAWDVIVALVALLPGCASTTDGVTANAPPVDGGVVDVAIADVVAVDVGSPCAAPSMTCGTVAAPRPIAPLSTATTTTQRPTLHWVLAPGTDGAVVQVCRDRACTMAEATLTASGTSVTLPITLAAGVHFWKLYGRSGTTTGSTAGPTWEFFVGHRSAPVDTSWGTVPDFNGDGFADVVVGAPSEFTVSIYQGGANGFASTPTVLTETDGTFFGELVASAGDLNGDGFADLVVAAPSMSSPPTAILSIFMGSPDGVAPTPTLATVSAELGEGVAIASAGDINGDGYADVIVGAGPDNETFVYLGTADGMSPSPVILAGFGGIGHLGSSVAGVGDLNGDGYADIAIGDTFPVGAVAVYMGGMGGLSSMPSWLDVPGGSGSAWISTAAAGDVDGDGYADVITGSSDGSALVYRGTIDGFDALFSTSLDRGSLVAGAGDFNGDGYSDVLCGSGIEGQGFAFYAGEAGGLSTTALPTSSAVEGDAILAMATAGDIDGDSYDDFVIGTGGSVFVYFGNASGLVSHRVVQLMGTSSFGASVASLGATRNRATRQNITPSSTYSPMGKLGFSAAASGEYAASMRKIAA